MVDIEFLLNIKNHINKSINEADDKASAATQNKLSTPSLIRATAYLECLTEIRSMVNAKINMSNKPNGDDNE